jgi:superfamily II DNA or RNA helicase
MTALDLLRPVTSHNAQQRGWDYVGRVRLVNSDNPDDIVAMVTGGETYDVTMRVRDDQLRVSCTCPYFSDRATPCKHLWALAIVADQRDLLTNVPEHAQLVIDIDDLEDHALNSDVEGLEPFGDYAQPMAHERRFPGNRRQPFIYARPYTPRHREPPRWETILNAVTPPPAPASAAVWSGAQLLYVLTAPPMGTVRELSVHVERRDRKRDGGWSKARAAALTLENIASLPDADDRWALSLLHGVAGYPRAYGSYGYPLGSQPLGAAFVKSQLLDLVLPRLCGTGRVRLRQQPMPTPAAANKDEDTELAWAGGPPWVFELIVGREGGGYQIDAVLTRGEARESVHRFALLTDRLAILDGVAAPFDPAGGFNWAAELRSKGTFVVPEKGRHHLVQSLVRTNLSHLQLPDDLRWTERRVTPRFAASIGAPNEYSRTCAVAAAAEYEDTSAPLDGGTRVLSGDGRVMYLRDVAAEEGALETLRRLGVLGLEHSPVRAATINLRKVTPLVHALVSEGWRVEAEGVRYRAIAAPRLRVKSGIDWFELDAASDTGEAIDMPDLLRAIATSRRTITLDDGTIGILPEEWLARVAPALVLGEAHESAVRFKPSQVALIDALLAAQPAVDWDEGILRARDALRRFAGVAPEDPPASFRGELRGYQREALGWMRFLREFGFGGCLADDMGLGKTVMVLAMLDGRRVADGPRRPSLIVVPRSLIFNWTSEAARFTPQLRVLDFAGADRHQAAHAMTQADVVLTTYGTLRRDVRLLQDQPFDYVVLDEAQAIKNAGTATAKAVRLLRADHRLALTGTPVENHLGELHSLFDFLNPGLLGRGKILDLRKQPRDSREYVETLARGLRPFFLRRTKEQAAPELPARTDETLYCELEGAQRRHYDELRDHYRRVLLKKIDREGMAKAQVQILEALLRLRQAACHTGLIRAAARGSDGAGRLRPESGADGSAKFDLLLPRLAELIDEGRKVLVFSQFTSLLALLRAELDAAGVVYEYLDGETRDRAARVERFQRDQNCPVFLISLKAGGVGLNLTAAEYVFLLDPWWNPAVEMQAIDRTHRIGQTRPVFAYRLVARDTVEERILELQARKRQLADAILAAGTGGLRGLQREDLEQLLA